MSIEQQPSINYQYSYMFRPHEVIIKLALQNILENVQNVLRSYLQQRNLYIPLEDIAKSKHVAVLIFYKKLRSMVICVFISL
jgi:hypothetical protein